MKSIPMIGIGLMCGTSQDALDICAASFSRNGLAWKHEILKTKAIELPVFLKEKLARAINMTALDLALLNNEVGLFFGNEVKTFVSENNLKADFVASHGITIFHQPEKQLTLQIGNGAIIASTTKIDTVCDFRTTDIALGGQGAPLVPFADSQLFSEYDFTLNLGGFCNLTETSSTIKGFDISVCNLALNYLMKELHLNYDENGKLASTGELIPELFDTLNKPEFFGLKTPKSLGKEWFDQEFSPLIARYQNQDLENRLFTVCNHIGFQIGKHLNKESTKCLVTGGGAFNNTLIECIKKYSKTEIIVGSHELINYKEALCFAFLGACRISGEINTLKSVTGADKDSIGGTIYLGN